MKESVLRGWLLGPETGKFAFPSTLSDCPFERRSVSPSVALNFGALAPNAARASWRPCPGHFAPGGLFRVKSPLREESRDEKQKISARARAGAAAQGATRIKTWAEGRSRARTVGFVERRKGSHPVDQPRAVPGSRQKVASSRAGRANGSRHPPCKGWEDSPAEANQAAERARGCRDRARRDQTGRYADRRFSPRDECSRHAPPRARRQ
jgi:hypothetical protein